MLPGVKIEAFDVLVDEVISLYNVGDKQEVELEESNYDNNDDVDNDEMEIDTLLAFQGNINTNTNVNTQTNINTNTNTYTSCIKGQRLHHHSGPQGVGANFSTDARRLSSSPLLLLLFLYY